MNRDDSLDRRDGSETEILEPAFTPEVMGTYDEVGGREAFVIAALDRDDAWIAVPEGTEVDVQAWQ